MKSLEQRRAKLVTLAKIEGFPDIRALLDKYVHDSVCPAICTNDDCDYTAEMEPDQDKGWCEACEQNSLQSALVLAGLI